LFCKVAYLFLTRFIKFYENHVFIYEIWVEGGEGVEGVEGVKGEGLIVKVDFFVVDGRLLSLSKCAPSMAEVYEE